MSEKAGITQFNLSISADSLVAFSFIAYFCAPLLRTGLRAVFGSIVGTDGITVLAIIVIYLPLLFACIIAPWKYIKLDFIVLLLGLLAFFAVSLLFHPEYAYWYSRPDYGVWRYVFIPTEGLYAYLFVRLIDEPDNLRKYIKIAGWLMMLYFAHQIVTFLQRGYWIGIVGQNDRAKMDHSVSFGYSVMQFLLFFLFDALQKKRLWDILGTIILALMMLVGGSRGPFVFLAVFLVLYSTKYFSASRNKVAILLLLFTLIMLFYAFYEGIMSYLLVLFSKYTGTTRLISSLLVGSFTEDAGRFKIWSYAIEMIKDNPWGYGAMGSQPMISQLIYVGYPHSIILEVMIDFGLFFGLILLVFLFRSAIINLYSRRFEKWSGVFLAWFGTACQLIISLCFWSSTPFWAAVGVGVNSTQSVRRKKKEGRPMLRKE